jgi:hypothetical protein
VGGVYARVAEYEVPSDRVDDALRHLESAGEGIGALDGNRGVYVLVDRERGTVLTFTLWRGESEMSASAVRAARLRQQVMREVGGAVRSVWCYEVAVARDA